MHSLKYIETPVTEIHHQLLKEKGIRLLIKREDLNHAFVSGNKWWKLKYNLEEAKEKGFKTVLTFGGSYSNHIYATAAAANALGFQSIGIIRGEEIFPLNHTLSFASSQGMSLHYISRSDYRQKTELHFLEKLTQQFGNFYLIPEGGTNLLALRGCVELGEKLSQVDCDHIILPVGTGGTLAGIIAGMKGEQNIIGVAVLKSADFLKNDINDWLKIISTHAYDNWSLLTTYYHGGYAKVTPELMAFITTMKREHNLPLDPVYTGKLFWAIFEEIKKDHFKRGSTILAIHTGGLQGAGKILNQYKNISDHD